MFILHSALLNPVLHWLHLQLEQRLVLHLNPTENSTAAKDWTIYLKLNVKQNSNLSNREHIKT
jgi:hypothetical protein